MHIIRKQAFQGHAVPATGGYSRQPFPPEVMAPPIIVIDDNDPDLLYPPGATAQNNYAASPLFKCRQCAATMTEEETRWHECGDDDGED